MPCLPTLAGIAVPEERNQTACVVLYPDCLTLRISTVRNIVKTICHREHSAICYPHQQPPELTGLGGLFLQCSSSPWLQVRPVFHFPSAISGTEQRILATHTDLT
jgi:hypothetical protein